MLGVTTATGLIWICLLKVCRQDPFRQPISRRFETSSASPDETAFGTEDSLSLAEEGQSPHPASVAAHQADQDVATNSCQGIVGSRSAVGRAVGNAVPRSAPALLDAVCLGLSVPIAGLGIKQALEESGKPSHDSTRLFMKATLPALVAVNSLRNLIKYCIDGRRV